ncbi:hypothetical protein Taro_006940, partial [Colocasia esculenta]|nr:hypothetical protein [Colocasia esculenta]
QWISDRKFVVAIPWLTIYNYKRPKPFSPSDETFSPHFPLLFFLPSSAIEPIAPCRRCPIAERALARRRCPIAERALTRRRCTVAEHPVAERPVPVAERPVVITPSPRHRLLPSPSPPRRVPWSPPHRPHPPARRRSRHRLNVRDTQLPVPPAVFWSSGTIVDSETNLPATAYTVLPSAFRSTMSRYPRGKTRSDSPEGLQLDLKRTRYREFSLRLHCVHSRTSSGCPEPCSEHTRFLPVPDRVAIPSSRSATLAAKMGSNRTMTLKVIRAHNEDCMVHNEDCKCLLRLMCVPVDEVIGEQTSSDADGDDLETHLVDD